MSRCVLGQYFRKVCCTDGRQSELLESFPEIRAKAAAETKAKLETLERKLGVSSTSDAPAGEGVKRIAEVDVEELARKKHKFDDSKFLEESREINESVRNAVGAALLKKRKKKTAAAGAKDSDKKAPAAAAKGKEKAGVAPKVAAAA